MLVVVRHRRKLVGRPTGEGFWTLPSENRHRVFPQLGRFSDEAGILSIGAARFLGHGQRLFAPRPTHHQSSFTVVSERHLGSYAYPRELAKSG